METLSCHSNQTNNNKKKKNNAFVEANTLNILHMFGREPEKLLSKYLQWDSNKCQFSFFPSYEGHLKYT